MDMKSQISELLSKAISLHQAGNLNEAEALYRTILSSNSKHFDALTLLGNIYFHRGNLEEGVRLIGLSLDINPKQPGALNNRGNALCDLKRYDEALTSFDTAIALKPGYAEAYNNRGNALNDLNRPDEALASCNQAIALKPGFAEACNNRGNALNDLNRPDEALASFDQAIALNPGYAEAYYNRGNALKDLKRPDEALPSYDQAIALKPGYAEAYNNRGVAFNDLKRHAEALASYDQAIALNPGYPETYSNKGVLKILLGEYEEGWELYEWRLKLDVAKKFTRNFPKPLWLGKESLADKTILLHTEQGLGDSVQFCRYVPMVEALGAKVVLEVQEPLVGLISTLKDSIRVIPRGSPLPEFDCHCPLMSLPLAFKTTVSTIPAKIPYLATDPNKQKLWQKKMGAKTKPRIGLVWSGAQIHQNDHNRSIPLDLLYPLLDLDLDFHCLQKEIRPLDRELLVKHRQIKTYENDLNDFSDTAALVSEMNLVISVDTSVAHLAGALGKPVWILLPFAPDYRWMTEREDSPWYPTARLFRQSQIGDWTSIIAKVAAELKVL